MSPRPRPPHEAGDVAPTERPLPRPSRSLGLAVSLSTALLALLGLIDLLSAEAVGARLFGGLVTAIGATLSAGALGLVGTRGWAPRVTLIGLVLLALMLAHHSILFVFDFFWLAFFDLRLLMFTAALWIITVAAAIMFFRARPQGAGGDRRSRAPRPTNKSLRESLELTALVGLALTGLSFWYTSAYLPTTRAPFLNLGIEAISVPAEAEPQDDRLPLRFRLTALNPGEVRVRVLGGWFNVTGLDSQGSADADRHLSELVAAYPGGGSSPEPTSDPAFGKDSVTSCMTTPCPDRSLRLPFEVGGTVASPDVLGSGTFPAEGAWLEPGEELSADFVIMVSEANAHMVRIDFDIDIARGERVQSVPDRSAAYPEILDYIEPTGDHPGGTLIGAAEWRVRPQSILDLLRRDPVSILVTWRRDDRGGLVNDAYVRQGAQFWVPRTLPADSSTWDPAQNAEYFERTNILLARLAETGVLVHTGMEAEVLLRLPAADTP